MNPLNIVGLCLDYGIDLVAVTDHNTAGNVRAVMECARGTAVTVWPGMEVQTKEEVHLVVLGDNLEAVLKWEALITSRLPDIPNRPELFGEQLLFDKEGRVTGVFPRQLLNSVDLSVDEVRTQAERMGLICYPAHIDRPAYSYVSNLGFLPPPGDFDLVEVSAGTPLGEVKRRFPSLEGRGIVVSSDAHRLTDLGPARTRLLLARPILGEFAAAIAGRGGRNVEPVH
jgi:hypothetical protein